MFGTGRLAALLLSLSPLSSLVAATALTVRMGPNEKCKGTDVFVTVKHSLNLLFAACFFAHVEQHGSKMAFYFAVQSGGSFDINYIVHGPGEKVILEGEAERQGDLIFTANEAGEYRFCLDNEVTCLHYNSCKALLLTHAADVKCDGQNCRL